jgi:hypothetical protein
MNLKSIRHFLVVAFHLLFLSVSAQTNEDIILITEARIAIENYDCHTAIRSLNKVSTEGRKLDLYSLYMAKACEGTNDLKNSIYYYEQYANLTSLTPELATKIATLRYKARSRVENISGVYESRYSGTEEGNIKNKFKLVCQGIKTTIYDLSTGEILFEGDRTDNKISGTWHYIYNSDIYDACNGYEMDVPIEIGIADDGGSITLKFPYVGCRMKKGEATLGILSALGGEQRDIENELYREPSMSSSSIYNKKL